jgi:hypothetical protein
MSPFLHQALYFFSGNTLMKKWNNIKDQFLKILRKKPKNLYKMADCSGKQYIYARQLSVLKQAGTVTANTQSSSNIDYDDDNTTSTTIMIMISKK